MLTVFIVCLYACVKFEKQAFTVLSFFFEYIFLFNFVKDINKIYLYQLKFANRLFSLINGKLVFDRGDRISQLKVFKSMIYIEV